MAGASTDTFSLATNNFSTTLSSSIGSTTTTIPLTSVTNLPTTTGTVLVVDRVNSQGVLTPSLREYFKGVVSGNNIVLASTSYRGLGNSSAQAHANGAVVEMVPDSTWANDIVNGILEDHVQLGYHGPLHDANGNMWIDQTATASAVNNLKVSNSATGNPIVLAAEGSDTNISYNIVPKGSGVVQVGGTQIGPQFQANPYKFSVYRNGGWTTPNSTQGLVTLDTETFDTNSNYSISTGKFTAPVAGFYYFTASAAWGSSSSNTVAYLYKNGSVVLQGPQSLSATHGAAVTGLLQLAANDYVQFYLYTDGAYTGATGVNNTYFHGFLVSAT